MAAGHGRAGAPLRPSGEGVAVVRVVGGSVGVGGEARVGAV